MTTKKTTTKKTVKKVTEEERFLKIVFTDQGLGIQGQNVSTVNHIEAILALIYSLHSNDPEMSTVKTCLTAIDFHRDAVRGENGMIAQLERLRDVLQIARERAEAKVKAVKKTTKKK